MDGVNINDLPGYAPLIGSEIFEMEQGGINKQVPLSALASYLGTASNLATVLSFGNSTGGTSIIVDDADYLFVGTSNDGYFHYNSASTRVELKNANSDDLIYFNDAGGITMQLNSGQYVRLENDQFLAQGNVAGTAKLQTSASSNLMYHPTANYFNAPLHNFVGDVTLASETASTIPWINASNAVKSSNMTSDGNWIYFPNNYGIDVKTTGGSDVFNIGTSNADVINIGWSGANINIIGNVFYENVTQLQVKDKLFTVNKGGALASGVSAGFEIEENGVATGYFATNGSRDGWDFKAPAITGVATFSLASLTGSRTYTLPDSTGTIALTSNLTGYFANGGNAFGATATLGTTDNYDLNFITNNTVVARFTKTGQFEFNGGNGNSCDVAVHQTAASAAGTGRIFEAYNNSFSKQMFAILDNGVTGSVYVAAGAIQINAYTGQSIFTGTNVSVRGTVAGNDHLAITPPTGIGGAYFTDSSGNPKMYMQNAVVATTVEILSSGVSYLAGGGLDMRATGGSGYIGFVAQSSNASAPAAAGFRLFAGATGSFNWVRNNGVSDSFVRTFDATLTADRIYTLPDASGTIPLGTGANTRLAYWSGASSLSSSASLVFDGTNFIIGTGASATRLLTVTSSTAGAEGILFENLSAAATGRAFAQIKGQAGSIFLYQDSTGGSYALANAAILDSTGASSPFLYNVTTGNKHSYAINYVEKVKVDSTGILVAAGTSATASLAFTVQNDTATNLLKMTGYGSAQTGNYGSTSLTVADKSLIEAGTTGAKNLIISAAATWIFSNASASTSVGMRVSSSGVYIGNNGSIHNAASVPLHVVKTTEQCRIAYDSTNYLSFTVSSAGVVTLDANGASAGFTFSDSITLADAKDIILNTTTGTKIGTATTQKIGFWNATPIFQPANTVAIDDVLVNTGLRASGGSANFTLKITNNLPQNLKGYTVAGLPVGVVGDVAYVTDALAPTFLVTVVGGGAVKAPVFYDGTNWVTF